MNGTQSTTMQQKLGARTRQARGEAPARRRNEKAYKQHKNISPGRRNHESMGPKKRDAESASSVTATKEADEIMPTADSKRKSSRRANR